MIHDKMVRARRQYHHYHHHNNNNNNNSANTNSSSNNIHHRHALNNSHRSNKRSHVPNAPSNTTQFIMNDHELIEPDFDLMHNAIMEHYNRSKRRKLQSQASDETSNHTSSSSPDQVAKSADHHQQSATDATHCSGTKSPRSTHQNEIRKQTMSTTHTAAITNKSPLKDLDDEESKNQQPPQQKHQQQMHQQQQQEKQTISSTATTTTQLQESTNQSNPTTPSYRPTTGSPGDEDGLSPFINHEHLHSEFQEVYANIHTERLSSMKSLSSFMKQLAALTQRIKEEEKVHYHQHQQQNQSATTTQVGLTGASNTGRRP